MNIRIAKNDEDIAACFPVIQELRPHIAKGEFLSRVRSQEASGYRLVFAEDGNGPVAVAGFRIGENLAWGRFLYVDDLVTFSSHRSKGYGSGLLAWLREYAGERECSQLHLDSGVQRNDAHRFYEREGMIKSGFHFVANTGPRPPIQ